MKITFIGATQSVTGSKSILEVDQKVYLIDCGLYQENQAVNTTAHLNQQDLKFLNTKFDGVILTHAHLDHSGLLPYLYKKGFRGPIYCTKETAKLTRIILEDSAELLKNAPKSNEEVLYSPDDVRNVISLFHPVKFEEIINVNTIKIQFLKAAHILGAAFVKIASTDKSIVFSGDLGRFDDQFLGAPKKLVPADYLVLESTYGGSVRESSDHQEEITKLIKKAIKNQSTLLISSFALHRAQYLTYLIKKIFKEEPTLKIPFFLNSPMMEQVFYCYLKFKEDFNSDIFKELSLEEAFSELHFLKTFWDIEERNTYTGPQIIVASSGMLTGGRIWSHLPKLATKEKTILFLPGYQAENTPGHKLINGEKILITPENEELLIGCEVIHSINFSSHGDMHDLESWLSNEKSNLKTIFLNHGEEKAKTELKNFLDKDRTNTKIVAKGETVEL